MHRLFVALRPPEAIRDLLVDAMDDGAQLRWVGEDMLHLTLRFIGEVEGPMAEDVVAALARVRSAPFELAVTGSGLFDHRQDGALWAGIAPREPITALAAKIERACVSAGCLAERRAFHPHITLARFGRSMAPRARDSVARIAGLASAPFEVARFGLFESRLSRHGAHHEEVASFRLG